MTSKDLFTRLIKHTFSSIREEIKMCLEWNQGFTFDSGKFGERVTFIVQKTRGINTNGGCAFDAEDGTESKACFTGQTYVCLECGAKNNYYSSSCHKCGGTTRKDPQDTRWGIDTKSHFLYEGQIPCYIFSYVEPLNRDIEKPSFRVRVYKVASDHKIFNEILSHQLTEGSKPHKNFMPFSQDFYMSDPALLVDCEFSVTDKVEVTYATFDLEAKEASKFMPSSLLTKSQLKQVSNREGQVLIEDVYKKFGIKTGAQGKSRGNLNRNKNR